VYSVSIKERFGDVDLVLSSGDLPLNYYDFIVSSLNKPLLFVFGNHNLRRMHLYRKPRTALAPQGEPGSFGSVQYGVGAQYVNLRVVHEKGLLVAGLGGSQRYSRQANQFTDRMMYLRVFRLIPRLLWNRLFRGRYVDVVITHAPPFGINDRPDLCHRGFRAFVWLIHRFRPAYFVHGHIHLYDRNADREQVVGDTRVINAYDHIVLEIDPPVSTRAARRSSVLGASEQTLEQAPEELDDPAPEAGPA
jgi:hypothetical protein